MTAKRRLTLLPRRFAVCRFPADSPLPVWIFNGGATVWSLTRTPTELSLVCPAEDLPPSVDENVESPWRAFVLDGVVPFETIGVIASLTVPLAEAGIPVFVLSTYDTDLLLIREPYAERARDVLSKAFEING